MSAVGVLLLLLLGIVASVFGALGGLGGAFIALPVLRFFEVPAQVAAPAALAMALANAASASIEYRRQRRIDGRVAGLFAVTGIPASIAGAYAVQHINGTSFDFTLAALQVCLVASLIWRSMQTPAASNSGNRTLVDATGTAFRYDITVPLLLAAGLAVGFASSFFGIGGGILMVPAMMIAMRMPAHLATATSSFAIVLTSPAGIATHFFLAHQALDHTLALSGILAAGGLVGGQIGARLAPKLKPAHLTWLFCALLLAASAGLIGRHVNV